MIQIRTKGEALDLPAGFGIDIEDTNPIYNERGSQSIPATVPTTRRNIRLLDAPHRIDAATDPNLPERTAEVIDGAYIRRGVMNITEASKKEGITFNVGFDNSTVYSKWAAKKLSELSDLPTYIPRDQGGGYEIDWLLDELYNIYLNPRPTIDDFAIFPLAVNKETDGNGADEKTYWEVLNVVGSRGLEQLAKVKRLIDGVVTEVSIPAGYCVSPFLRVWRVLELIFSDLGVIMQANPFKSGELAKLVVLNNAADSCCRAEIKYSDLMPDCTVEEFMNALWVRFGLVYNVDYNTGVVYLQFIKDIINQRGARSIDDTVTGFEKITFDTRQYVKLSAQTSIEGAAPSNERFEDFAKGLDVSKVRLGTHVSQWTNTGTQDDPKWDGDVRDDYWDDDYRDDDYPDPEPWDPDYPDPDDDRDDGRDDGDDRDDYGDYYAMRAASRAGASVSTTNDSFLAREFITGMWYRLDATNNKVRLSSSSFFNWDPQPEGLTALDLSSDDECVPIARVSTVGTGTNHSFNDRCPLYLFGARHYHSYIKGSDETEESGDQTPLAFMFAYTKGGKTFGRLNGEGDDGQPMTLDDGTKPTISLLFQFKDGLFAKFWADYDEILRHGNRAVEVSTRVNTLNLLNYNILSAYKLKGIRCLIDTMTYSLPAGREIPVDMKLRTIQTQGKYDIAAEQNVPDFSAAARHLEWRLKQESWDATDYNTWENRTKAATKYKQQSGYKEHGEIGDYWYVGAEGAIYTGKAKGATDWKSDATLQSPTSAGQVIQKIYKGIAGFDIFEVHD
ncbi:MAG: hypothetical protein NC301_09665, partial [Bacteroides sp.]|nr:hypothetical protein [Bacteroides sp.]